MRLLTRARKITLFLAVTSFLLAHRGSDIHAQSPALIWDGLLEHVTTPSVFFPQPSPNGSSQLPRHSVSADGRYVLFTSDATNLGTGGFPPVVYLRDRDTGQSQDLFFGMSEPALSGDGSQIAYRMCEPGWRPDNAPICDVWVFNQLTWTFSTMSVAPDGAFGNADSGQPVISANGRFVVFRTNATNLLPPGAAPGQLVVRDRDADGNGIFDEPGSEVIEVVSAVDGSLTPGNGVSDAAEVSDDGRYVAFRSMASNLVSLDTNGGWDVFERDRVTHETRLLDRQPTGGPSPVPIDQPEISMSADGRFVAFVSSDRYLVGSPDTQNLSNVYVYDRDTQVLARIDVMDGDARAIDPDHPMLSADGRYVAIEAWAKLSLFAGFMRGVFVFDRATGSSTKVSVLPGGGNLNWPAQSPAISGDGTVVLFTSKAPNVAPGLDDQFDKIFAAVHFDVQPTEIVVPGNGGRGTFTVTTQAHTRWSASPDWSQNWFYTETPPFGLGSGPFTVNAAMANPNPTPRSVSIAFGSHTVKLTEEAGLSLTSVSPSAGPASGGTVLTLRGTGFEPGMEMWTTGGLVPTEFVDQTTLHATTPPSEPGLTGVGVLSADGQRFSWMDSAFRYLDPTPPLVFNGIDGTLGQNDWYTSDVTVHWGWYDGESQITATSGCGPTIITADTPGTTVTCSVTSEGGTTTNSVTIKRDATPPTVVVAQPKAGRYEQGQIVPAAYTCTDATSGIDSCSGSAANGDPIDVSYAGFDHQFLTWAMDKAGNWGYAAVVHYDVAADFCWGLDPRARAWWRMEGDTTDVNGGLIATGHNLANAFLPAIEGQGFAFPDRTSGFLQVAPSSRFDFDSAMTIALWLKPQQSSAPGVLLEHPSQYRLQRLGDGSIQWTFFENDGGSISAIVPAAAPQDAWTHLVITFDGGVVKTYVNGRLVQTNSRTGSLQPPSALTGLTIGGQDQDGAELPFVGGLDELQLVDYVLPEWLIGNLYLSHGVCLPEPTSLAVNMATTIDYGTTSFSVGAVLTDENGQGIFGKPLTLSTGAATITLVTDANGLVSWNAPANFGPAGTYPNAFTAVFEGDAQNQRATISRDIVVQKLTPMVTWLPPADIPYGTPLGASQLDATSDAPGTFTYTPPAGTVPGAGTQPLSVTFHPSDAVNYNDVTIGVALTVQKAVPAMSITGGSFTYDGQPHAASASASDYLGQPLTPVTITYNGSSSAPVNAGSYNAVSSFAGDPNHLPRSVSATIAIDKATPAVTWPPPGAITYGAPLGAAQLNATANVPGTFTYTPPAGTRLAAGAGIALSATFAPTDAVNYVTVTTNRSIDVLRAPLTISAANTTKVFGTPLPVFTANGSGFVNGDSMATLSGTLVFNTAATATSPVGSYPVTVGGVTSPNYAITFVAGSLTITQASSVVTAAATVSPSGSNQAVTFNASVSIVAPGAGTPTGTVEFRDGSTRLGTVELTNGSASLTTNGLSAASHTINAIYSGNANVAASTRSFPHVVLTPAQSSTTAITSSSNPATTGANVTLTATVTAPSGLSGNVAFYDGTTLIGTVALSGTKAKLVIATLATGTHAITGRYAGNATIPPSISPVFAQVVKPSGTTLRTSTATVVASPSPSALDQLVTFTATVAGNQSTPPTGVVVLFVDGTVVSGPITLSPFGNASSRATFTTSALAHGVHNVEVAYLGDGTYKGDAGTTSLTVN
jgi:hypothetical protein